MAIALVASSGRDEYVSDDATGDGVNLEPADPGTDLLTTFLMVPSTVK
jgi:hypothetical protein